MLIALSVHRIRNGITLMEVLISIGILSIGLASVIAIIPAGAREAQRALIIDRGSALAANAMADAITIGLLDQATWTTIPPGNSFVVDPLGSGNEFRNADSDPILEPITTKFATAADSIFRGQDDLAYEIQDDGDSPSLPVYANSQRVFRGAYSCLATLVPVNPQQIRLSIVVFHLRSNPSTNSFAISSASGNEISLSFFLPLPEQEFRDAFGRGSCVLLSANGETPVWRQIRLPLPESSGGSVTQADLLLDSPPPFTPTWVNVFPGSIGFVEKIVSLEGPSPWSL